MGDEAGSISPNYEDADANGAGDLESTITKLRALLAQRESGGGGKSSTSTAGDERMSTSSFGKLEKSMRWPN